MDKINSLTEMGLSETESKIYLCLLGSGEITAVKIAKETGIHRRTVYDNLEILMKKGLVSFKIESGTKYFSANDPTVLKTTLEEKMFTLNKILPSLTQSYKQKKDNFKVEVLKGKDAAKMIMQDAVDSNETVLWLGGGLYFVDYFKHSKAFVRNKLLQSKIRMIQPHTECILSKIEDVKPIEFRLLPEKYKSLVGFAVYKNKVALGTLETKDVTIILIENKIFSDAFRNYFELIWSIADKA